MTDQMRDMIAQLMGSQHVEDSGKPRIPFDHPSVCRAYLLGVCPHDLVPDSRLQSVVSCRKLHEPAHKADYQRAQKEKDLFYDIDAFEILDFAVRQVDVEVEKVREKLEDEVKSQSSVAADTKAQKIAEIEEKIAGYLEAIEKMGNEGKIEESLKVHKLVEEMKEKIEEITTQVDQKLAGPGSNASKLRVCEDCGAQLNIMDHETRIADHYNGKMHLGMVETRETYNRMKETIEERRKEMEEKLGTKYTRFGGRSDRGDYRDRERDRRDRERRRSRSRSRDRYRSTRDDKNRKYRDDRDKDRNRDRRDRRY